MSGPERASKLGAAAKPPASVAGTVSAYSSTAYSSTDVSLAAISALDVLSVALEGLESQDAAARTSAAQARV